MIIKNICPESTTAMTIFLNEYQLFNVITKEKNSHVKRKLLCQSEYYFYIETEEDNIQKLHLNIKDSTGAICFSRLYSQVDNYNRRYLSNK